MTTPFSRLLVPTVFGFVVGSGYAQSPADDYGISLPNDMSGELPIPDEFPVEAPLPTFTPEYMHETVGTLPESGLPSRLNSHNSRSGAELLEHAARVLMPQENRNQYPKLAEMIDVVGVYLMNDDVKSAESLTAQIGGAGLGNLHGAWRSQVERHLRNFGQRLPYCLAAQRREKSADSQSRPCAFWANAELGTYRVDSDDFAPGCRLRSCGGTVGAAMPMSESLTLGLALSGRNGRLSSDTDYTDLKADLDSVFVSAFVLWQSGRWQHRVTGCMGIADVSFERSVYMPTGYATKGDTDGLGLGICYEVTRDYVISSEPGDCMSWHPFANVSYTFTRLAGCTENGGDAALKLAADSSSNVIFGLGARLRNVVDESGFGAPFAVDIRLQGLAVAGPRRGEAEVSLRGVNHAVVTHGADPGAVGAEFGLGINLPLRSGHGAVFADCSVYWGSNGGAVSGVLGYGSSF